MIHINPRYTLCFLTHDQHVLMLLRLNPPNQGLWNGVGGHIEPGESPYDSCLREVAEETGIKLHSARFDGLLTWQGFEIPAGGLFLFSAQSPTREHILCSEGLLDWKPIDWTCRAPEVVGNLHIVLPFVFNQSTPQRYHFTYAGPEISHYQVEPMDPQVDIHAPWTP